MMKYIFTNLGVQQLQEWLYAQDNESLAMAAQQLRNDFKAWVADHFELTAQQLQYLSQLDEQSTTFFAAECAFAVGNRLNISLDKEGVPSDDQGKVIWTTNTLIAKNENSAFEAAGHLCFHIRYS
jgi:hypothetical protein